MAQGEKKLSEFLRELAESLIETQEGFESALAQLSPENQEILKNRDLRAAREVILEETGQEPYFIIIHWLSHIII